MWPLSASWIGRLCLTRRTIAEAVSKIGNADDQQRHGQRDGRDGLHDAQKRDRREREAQEERSRVSHEDRCGIEVVAQEAEARTDECRSKRGRLELVALSRQDEEGSRAAIAETPGREPVESVDQVDDVGEPHDVDERDRDARADQAR